MGTRSRKAACSFVTTPVFLKGSHPESLVEMKAKDCLRNDSKTEPLHIQPMGNVWSCTAKPQYIRKCCFSEMDGKAPSEQGVLVPTL